MLGEHDQRGLAALALVLEPAVVRDHFGRHADDTGDLHSDSPPRLSRITAVARSPCMVAPASSGMLSVASRNVSAKYLRV